MAIFPLKDKIPESVKSAASEIKKGAKVYFLLSKIFMTNKSLGLG